MNIPEFLDSLAQQQIQFFVEDGRLRYRAASEALSEELLAQIRKRRAELIAHLQDPSAALEPSEPTGAYALSPGQEALWFVYELDRSSLAYNILCATRLRRDLDHVGLQDALDSLAARHEVLRSRFGVIDGKPYQRIMPAAPVELGVTQADGWSESEIEQYIKELADQPFDLEGGLATRWHLVTNVADDAQPTLVLALIVHHLVVDFRSLEILFRDLTHLYNARRRGAAPVLPPLVWTISDYVRWAQAWPHSEAGRQARAYWLEQLSGELPILDLPTDFARPLHQQYAGATLISIVPPHLTTQLKAFARQHLVTPYVVLLSTLGILLSRYSRQHELLIGSPMLGRNRSELSDMVGHFVNLVVLRLQLDEECNALSLLARVRQVVLDALAHQDYPFPLLVKDLRPQRDPSRSPLFQASFVYQRTSGAPVDAPGIVEEMLFSELRGAVHDLTLNALESGDTLRLSWEYSTALFQPATIERMCGHFVELLHSLLAHPEQPINELNLLPAAERQQLLVDWNATAAPLPPACVPQLFEAQVARTPEATAVVFEDDILTYAELNRRANQLAHHLRSLGAGPGTLVGVYLDRSFEMVIALLGVMKSGAAYVPLDPNYPAERLRTMMRDSNLSVIVAQSDPDSLREILDPLSDDGGGTGTRPKVVDFCADRGALAAAPSENPAPAAGVNDFVYVIYTSGSTGTPKGAAVRHRGFTNLVHWYASEFALSTADTVLLVSSFSFDLTQKNFFAPLISGAKLHVLAPGPYDPGAISRCIASEHITLINCTPSAFYPVVERSAGSELASLRWVVLGGEPIVLARVGPWLRDASCQAQIVNTYGPTECTDIAIFHRVSRLSLEAGAFAPTGRPIPNVAVLIADPALRPCPLGVPGELCIAGVGVGAGYIGDPALTAEKFIPDPFSREPGARLYRTGDLMRSRADGALEFLGRLDHQVKIRGFRVELGEIETVIAAHPAVRNSVVLCREDEPGGQQLVAYLECDLAIGHAAEKYNALAEGQVGSWRNVFNHIYEMNVEDHDERFDTSGWISSYTGQLVPLNEMKAWLDETVSRILALEPRRVMEIGCGTGMLLHRIAPHVQTFTACDISDSVLVRLQAAVDRQGLQNVTLRRGEANSFGAADRQAFDTVILNSVVQYFPSVEYLLDVLGAAVEAVADGGAIFLGDVRSLPLAQLFHASVEFHRASGECRRKELIRRVTVAAEREEELLIDPEFFSALGSRFSRLGQVDIHLKRGSADNEMSKFRYDVVLRVGPQADASCPDVVRVDASEAEIDGDELRLLLAEARSDTILVQNVLNQRLVADSDVWQWLSDPSANDSVGVIRARLALAQPRGIDPQEAWQLGESLGYSVSVRWSAAAPDSGRFDVLFHRSNNGQTASSVHALATGHKTGLRPWNEYTNDPVRNAGNSIVVSEVRELLVARLPAYMIPSRLVCLDRFPLTPNGKLDRKALPEPEPAASTHAVAPRNVLEEILVGLWVSVLHLSAVGIHDNFFELGGHSLLATQLTSRVREALGMAVPVRWLFEAPTVAELAGRIQAAEQNGESAVPIPTNRILAETTLITPDLLTLVSLTQAEIDQVVSSVEGGISNVQDIYPLAPLQEGIFFHHRLQNIGDLYINYALMAFDSAALSEAFIAALQAVVDRHDILRTAVVWEQLPEPVQVVWRQAPLHVEKLHFYPAIVPIAEQLVEQCHPRHTRIDLTRAPLLRIALAEDGERTLLLLLFHHLIMDHTTLEVLLEEITAHLRGEVDGLPAPVPFRNFVATARGGVTPAAHEKFFGEMLGDIEMPTAPFGLLDVRGDGAAIVEARRGLTPELARRLRTQAARLGATPAALYHLAWALVLSRCCGGQKEVVFGTVLFGRMQGGEGVERALGMFLNTLPLRVSCDGRPVAEALRETQQSLLALLRHEHASLSLAQRCSALPAPTPLFSALFNYRHSRVDTGDPQLEGVEVLQAEDRSNYPLTLSVDDLGEGFGLTAQVDPAVDPDRICAFMQHALEALVTALEEAPQTPLCALDILPAAERQQLLVDWNATAAPLPPACVPQLFEAQVARTPEATAVVFEDDILTYAELNRRANQLAHHLRSLGAGPGTLVGVYLDRSFEMVIALLGVMKSGAAYVPLDPNYPAERLRTMMRDSNLSVIVAQSDPDSLREILDPLSDDGGGTGTRPKVVDFCADRGALAAAPSENPAPAAGVNDFVYVIYTSGSTGTPKGAAVRHRGFTNLVHWYASEFALSTADTVLLVSSFSFDLTQKNFFAPLISGAKLHVLAPGPYDPGAISRCIASEHITLINCTPSAFYPVVERSAGSELASLRWVVLGGEPIVLARVGPWLRDASCQAQIVNTYGPTECTDIAIFHRVSRLSLEAGAFAPTGRPIPNVAVLIADPALRPCPLGVPGELCIAGVGVGAGYIGDPALTAEKFIPDPFSREPGARLYRTGDLMRSRADGALEFLGRLDHQVKIRGFRVELGEIETALAAHEGIREAVVIARPQDNGDQRLVAYLVAAEAAPAAAELRGFLQKSLPDYMLPLAFVFLPALPLTLSGKIDRAALPAPKDTPVTGTAAPQTITEELVAEIWADLLCLEQVDCNADFFELGGHSLLATQVIVCVHDNFGIDLPLEVLFERPTVASLAAAIDADRGQRLPPLTPLLPDADLAPSFSQQRLWFLDQLEEGNTAYNMPATMVLRGSLDEAAFRRALHHVVERHASLRLCFPSEDGQPRARLLAPYDPLSFSDLSHLPAVERSAEAERLQAEHAGQSFWLAEGPLFRLHLVRLERQRHQLLFNMHHIVSDGWSIDLLIREIGRLYSAYHRGEAPDLPPLPVQYTDFAAWQRQWLQGAVLEEQLHYWREQLTDAPELMALPTDFPRPALLQHRGGVVRLKLDAGLVGQLRSLARAAGGTLFMALMTAFNILLYRYSGQTDLCVGTPVANRSHGQLEHLIGLFLNVLVIRTRIPPAASFYGLLAAVRRATLGAYAHQDLPFEYLVARLSPLRSLSHNPVFQVMLNLVNTRSADVALDGLEIEYLDIPPGQLAKYDLGLSFFEDPDGSLDGRMDYNTELFTEETVSFLSDCFVRLVAQIIAHPDAPLDELTLLNAAWHDRTAAVRQPQPALPPVHFGAIEQSIPSRFAAQVRAHPERTAVRTPTTTLTYRELDQAARRLAAALLDLAATPRVALLLPHETALAVGILGVLQAGLTYVPLDAAHGIERLGLILDDTGASVIVCSAPLRLLAEQLAGPSRHIVNLDELTTAPITNLPAVAPDSIAYLLYTSGSTGQPKGVVQSHRNVLHFIRQYTERLHIRPEDRLLQVASYAFDAGVMDIFGALFNGATLYPVDLRQTAMTEACDWLAREAVTIFHATPTVYRHIIEVLDRPLPAIRLVVLGGESVVRSDVEAFRRHFGRDCLFVNGLGPTESTVTLQYFLDHTTPVPRFNVPVGYPVGDTDVLLLDAGGKVSELYGEITIRSAHVALGYWQQDSASFCDDPEHPGKRRYRTGDLARLLPDGSLEVVGRCDNQVKLRGFRVELGEVEAVLRQHPEVRQAVMTLWTAAGDSPTGQADRRLVAYVSGTIRPADLKAYAQQKLPDYMAPAAVMVLPSLPMTITGKLDRRSLPPPSFEREEVISVAPHNETEALLANLWSKLLGVPLVSVDSNFFELGGHSLLATQLISRIRDSFTIDLPLRTLFEHPLLHDQAALLDQSRRGHALPLIEPRPDAVVVPLSFAQQRLWFLAELEGGVGATYNITAALRVEGELDQAALGTALRQLTGRQQSLRMNFRNVGGQPVIVLREPYDPLTVEDPRGLVGEEQETAIRRLADKHARQPFALADDPLLRLTLVELGADAAVLLFSIHHIIADGWSLGVLVRELSGLYAAACGGVEADLPPLPIQYPDYAAWQRQWLSGEVLERQVAYWREQLAGAPSLLELPTDYPRPAVKSYRGAQLVQSLKPELVSQLQQLSRSQGATLYMALLAAFSTLLSRYSGQEDVVVGSPIANRTQRQTEGLIGFFVNTLVLRSRVAPQQSFTELLAEVRQTALGAYAHQDLPFEKLVDEVQPERSLGHSPLFQVMFALQNTPDEALTLGGLQLQPLMQEQITAKFDLTVNLEEKGGGLVGVWEYSTDLFEAPTITRMAAHFAVLLRGIVADPEQALSRLPLLTETEQQQLAVWNHTATDYPRQQTVAGLFAEQAARTPEAVALVFAGGEMSYGELEARTNRLAHYLKARYEIAPDQVIGVCLERSAELIVGMLAILKAGAAYLPLDADYPPERLRFMLEDAGVSAIVTHSSFRARLPEGEAELICLDQDGPAIDQCPAQAPASAATAESLAYVMYTSGSTGQPKGVCIPQHAVVRLVKQTNYARLTADEVFLQYAPVSFDAATFEIWGALLNGATLVLMPPEQRSLAELGAVIQQQGITTLWLTSSLFNLLIDEQPTALQSVRQLVVGGEALSVAHICRALEQFPACQFINGYGPTENTTFTCCYAIEKRDYPVSIPIGGPIANTTVYLLDEQQQPAPIGIPAELYTGGDGLARGYLARPELTAERFVEVKGLGRLYRTGDRCRWRADGTIEFLGRLDEQIKLRGFRIEPGEIETLLRGAAGVKDAAVVAHGEARHQQLVAYVVPGQAYAPAAEELRDLLKAKLPSYMVPSTFVLLDALPLTHNGKVDYRALPAPDRTGLELERAFKAPRTAVEAVLAETWGEVLGLERVGIHDNFFDLGGHSLLATQIISRLRDAFQVELPLRRLFEAPTVAGLAEWIEAIGWAVQNPQLVPVDSVVTSDHEQGEL